MMKRLTFVLLGCLIVTGCSKSLPITPEAPKFTMPSLPKMPKLSLPSWAKPKIPSIDIYQPTIMQGSVLDPKEVSQLRLGMTKEEVKSTIGSPSIIDPFHQYQWDYINHSTMDDGLQIQYRLRLIFNNDLLSEIDKSGLDGLSNSS